MQKISFVVDGQKLHGTIFYPENIKEKNPAILFLHGWMSSEQRYLPRAEALTKLGYICLTFTMRGHGESEGDIKKQTCQDFLNDTIAAYDFLTEQKNVDRESISVVGASFGAYLATLVTQKRKVKHLALRVPANYPDENLNKSQYDFSGDDSAAILKPRFSSLEDSQTYIKNALNNFLGDVLIIESEHDDVIPHQIIEDYLNSVKEKKKLTYVVMKGADHALKNERTRAEFIKILTDWFSDKL